MKRKRRPAQFAARAAQAKITRKESDEWEVAYFKRHGDDDPDKSSPGREYLTSCPSSVRAFFSVVLVLVAEAPPNKFAGGGYWEAMRDEMSGYYEVRKKHGGKLYRLFCRLDRDSQGTKPLLTVICGMTKADRTKFSKRDYAKVAALGDEYLSRNPRSVA